MLAALVASSALGYAPMMQPLRAARSCAVSMAVSDMPGISTETGNVVWDPMGLSENMDDANLKLVRAAELKHGRVAMLAVVGWIWTATGTHFEGLISTSKGVSFADLAAAPNPILSAAGVPGAGIWQMIFAIGALEVSKRSSSHPRRAARRTRTPSRRHAAQPPPRPPRLSPLVCSHPRLCCSLSPQVFWESKYPSYECAGNFGVPAVTNDPAKLKELQTIELKHGRCARPPSLSPRPQFAPPPLQLAPSMPQPRRAARLLTSAVRSFPQWQ